MSKEASKKNVLILDGDADCNSLFDSFFMHVGYSPIYAESEENAVDEIQKSSFSLILVDIFSLGMNQLDTLKKLHKAASTNNSTPIVIITKENKKELVANSIKLGARDYLAKPIDKKIFVKHIGKIIPLEIQKNQKNVNKEKNEKKANNDQQGCDESEEKRTLVEDLIYKLKNDKLDFSAMPQLGYKIIELLRDEKTSLKKVNEFIEKDPGIFSRILKSANSAVYAAGKQVYSPKDAIMRIGIKRTVNYVLIISSARLFVHPDPTYSKLLKEILEHSICAAICAREIAVEIQYPSPDNLFAFGLLHDIGKVLLLRILNQLSKQRDLGDEESVIKVLEQLHSKFGATLMKKWDFPHDFYEAILCHHEQPNISKHAKPTVITALANIMAKEIDNGTLKENAKSIMKLPHNKLIGYRPKDIESLIKLAEKEKQIISSLLD